ncbi:MAG: hypothetical protein AAGJ82_11205 [Bacteroidota bacterium]
MRLLSISILLLTYCWCFSCAQDQPSQSAVGETATASTTTLAPPTEPTTTLLDQYFPSEVTATVLALKTAFDEELRKGYNDRSIAYVYEQHALRMKLDFLNNEPFQHILPYNGKYRLSSYSEEIAALPFMTKKCGFQKEETKEIVNYWCFNTNEAFFEYLARLGAQTALIERFRSDYLEYKTITQDIRQEMLLTEEETFDFNNLDQQIFYFLFHATVNEEYWAMKEVQ